MQTSFSDLEYAGKKKQTRRERFLAQLEAALAPFYPTEPSRVSRRPVGLSQTDAV